MAKPLSDILKGVKASKTEPGSTGTDPGVDYAPKAKAERDWVAKHKTEKHEDRVGNTDAPYKDSTKYVLDDEKENKHGNKQKEAEAVYEAAKKNVEKPTEVHAFKAQVSKDRGPTKIVRLHVKMKTPNEGHEIAAKHLEKQGYDVHQTMHVGKVSPLFAKPVNEQLIKEATAKQINDRLDSLTAAKKAEKAGDKKAQYQHMADYHAKYATHVKKPDDIAHHKSQADIYRSASKAFSESLKCNMTNEGTHCPVHEMSSCTSKPKKTLRELRKGFNEGAEDGAGSTEEDLDENAKGYATKTKVLDAIKSLSQEHAKKHPNDFFIVHHSAEKIGQKAGVSADTVHKHMKSGVQGYASKRLSGGKLGYRYVGESLAVPLVGGDDESAEMAKTQLRALANKAMALAMYLSDDMVVEPWVQAKIAVAKDQVTAVHDYMVYGDKKEQAAPNDTPITFPGMNVDAEVGARL